MSGNDGERLRASRAVLLLQGAAAGAIGLWLWQTVGLPAMLWPALVLIALSVTLGLAWRSRASAARPFAAWDAYAERELAAARVGLRLH